jgi:hypothetical protein
MLVWEFEMTPPKSEQELELLVKAEHAYANRTEEFCNDYKSWMAGARSVVRAAQSETELLRKRIAGLREALELGGKIVERYDLDCGDNSCYFKAHGKGGMRTNGGCRCVENKTRAVENVARVLFQNSKVILLADDKASEGGV